MNFSFGATQDTYVYLPVAVSRVIQITSAMYVQYEFECEMFTGSLTCTALTQLYAVCIAFIY